MVDFGMFKYFLLSACCIPHTHLRPGAGLARGRYDRQGPTALESTLCSADMTVLPCFLHADFHHVVLVVHVLVALAQLEVADNSSSTAYHYNTTT